MSSKKKHDKRKSAFKKRICLTNEVDRRVFEVTVFECQSWNIQASSAKAAIKRMEEDYKVSGDHVTSVVRMY